MKLLNARTLKIEEFFGSKIPKYAILSHRWEEEEVTYQDLLNEEVRSQKRGWAKILKTCELALDQELQFAWVDTCCINKQDFSELTEAINSMFNWYARSEVCYAYLSDVDDLNPLEESLWFTRGWTLQELIAPNNVQFFNSSWNQTGTRADFSEVIHQRTGISEKVLSRRLPDGLGIRQQLNGFPVAVRMSWASERKTTRDEDRSYSLLGLFGVNMPLLYGEGDRAFIRLQEEIIKETNDLTLFAWTSGKIPGSVTSQFFAYRGILAISPDEFKYSEDLRWNRGIDTNPEFVMTNKGLRITADSMRLESSGSHPWTKDFYFLSLGCRRVGRADQNDLGIILVSYSGTHEECVFARAAATELGSSDELSRWTYKRADPKKIKKSFFIKKHVDTSHGLQAIDWRCPLTIEFSLKQGVDLVKAVPMEEWNVVGCSFSTVRFDDFTGFVEVKIPRRLGKSNHFIVPCWTGPNGEFWHYLVEETGAEQDIYKAALSEDWEQMRRLCTKAGVRESIVIDGKVYASRFGSNMPFFHRILIQKFEQV